MSSINKVILIGRLGSDPEKKFTPSGSSVCRISLATNEVYTDRNNERHERTEWHKIVLWGKTADLAEQYLKKGSQIYLEGSLRTNEWTDKEGNKRTTVEIHGREMKFLDSKRGGSGSTEDAPPPQRSSVASQPKRETNPQAAPTEDEYIEDDIPF